MSIYQKIKKKLLDLGFEKTKEKYWFKKAIDDEYYLIVCFEKQKNFYISLDGYHFIQTHKSHCDLRVAIGMNSCRLCSVNQIVGLWGKAERILGYIKNEDDIAFELLDDFKTVFYNPLFTECKIKSLYDFMCFIDEKNYGFIIYNSYNKAYAAYREKRYKEALFCLKAIFYQYMYNIEVKPISTKCEYLLDKEYEYEITNEAIEKLRLRLKNSLKWDNYFNIFELYDKLGNTRDG